MSNKKVLITGGHTQIPIDKVRVISNIFKGKTACNIVNSFYYQWKTGGVVKDEYFDVTVLGNPEMEEQINTCENFISYKTYDDLYSIMEKEVKFGDYDAIIHSAAVSDYYVSSVVTEPGGTKLDSSGKISSSNDTIYLELKKTRKIIDDIRNLWGFKGKLVKFKLQVDMSDEELLSIARKSRTDSQADIIVANCLEWAKDRAYVISDNKEVNIPRDELPSTLYEFLI